MISSSQIFRNLHAQAAAAQREAVAPAAARKTVQSGQAMGFNLTAMIDPGAKLADSMEELSMMFEEKAMKTVGQRKLGEKRQSEHLRAVKEWQGVLPDMPGHGVQAQIIARLRKRLNQLPYPEADDLLEMLEEASDDPSHQFAMLDAMERGLGKDERAFRELIGAAREKLSKAKGNEIRAGINLAEAVNERAKDAAEMRDLRQLYRGNVLGFTTPQECFRKLLASRGAGRLDEAIDFLVKGCGLDLQSPSPSQSPEELRRILLDLQCVQVLKTTYDKLGVLAGKMPKQFGETSLLDGEALTGRLMDLTEAPFVSADDVGGLVKGCGFSQPAANVYFMTDLLNIVRTLSPRLFPEESDRFKLVDACQGHLDALVEKIEDNG